MPSLVRRPERQVPETAVDRPAEDLTSVPCAGFDLARTLESGQLFRWRETPWGGFRLWIGGSPARVSQEGDRLLLGGVSPERAREFFALDADLPAIERRIGADPVIREALARYAGLRVIRQEPWECIASFTLSAYNNIPRLTRMLDALALRFGKPASFPAPGRPASHRLCRPGEAALRLALGRRSPAFLGQTSEGSGNPARAGLATCSAGHPRRGAVRFVPAEPDGGGVGQAGVSQAERPGCPDPERCSGDGRARPRARTADSEGRPIRPAASPRPRTGWLGPIASEAAPGREQQSDGRAARGEDRIDAAGGEGYGFPAPETLADAPDRALRECGLGYRAPYLKAAARRVASGGVDLEGLRGLEDEPLRRALLALPGVGEKVAECVMLFAYQRTAAFPVDVWIGRAMRRWYFRGRKASGKKIREFARRHFGPDCGWAQQYLYCLAREGGHDS